MKTCYTLISPYAISLGWLILAIHMAADLSVAQSVELTIDRTLDLAHRREALHRNSDDLQFAWIPGQHKLIYSAVSEIDGKAWIYLIGADDAKIVRLFEGSCPKVSPDGSKVAFIAPEREGAETNNKAVQIWLRGLNGKDALRLTNLSGGVAPNPWSRIDFEWSPDSKGIAYIPSVYHDTAESQVPSDEIGRQTMSSARTYPFATSSVLYRWSPDIHVVNTTTLSDEVVLTKVHVRLAGWINKDTIYYQAWKPGARSEAELFSEVVALPLKSRRANTLISGYNRQLAYNPILNAQRSMIAFRADPGEEVAYPFRRELGSYSLSSGNIKILTQDAAVTIGTWTPDGNRIVATDGPSTRRNFFLFSLSGEPTQLTTGPGVNVQPRFSTDGRLLAWRYSNGSQEQVLRVGAWDGTSIGSAHDLVNLEAPLAKVATITKTVDWRSNDKLLVDGYLTVPSNFQEGRQYPLIVMLHGGPLGGLVDSTSEFPGDVYFPSLLASQGYVVFRPDFRGSGNLGYKKILNAREQGESLFWDFQDVMSGIAELENKGIADPNREFVVGHSYGSILTNWIITHSHKFRGAVSYDGADYLADWGGTSWYDANYSWEWYMRGTPWEASATYHRNSAVANAKGATIPTLFVACGGSGGGGINSPAMLWLYTAFRRQGVDTEYVLYPDEAHVVSQPRNQADLLRRIVAWIKEHDTKPESIQIELKSAPHD